MCKFFFLFFFLKAGHVGTMQRIETNFLSAPITALAFYGDHVLAGKHIES